nr:MAG TPA: hypothetical protein [Caudoviricetes sp.]
MTSRCSMSATVGTSTSRRLAAASTPARRRRRRSPRTALGRGITATSARRRRTH